MILSSIGILLNPTIMPEGIFLSRLYKLNHGWLRIYSIEILFLGSVVKIAFKKSAPSVEINLGTVYSPFNIFL